MSTSNKNLLHTMENYIFCHGNPHIQIFRPFPWIINQHKNNHTCNVLKNTSALDGKNTIKHSLKRNATSSLFWFYMRNYARCNDKKNSTNLIWIHNNNKQHANENCKNLSNTYKLTTQMTDQSKNIFHSTSSTQCT